MKKYRLKEEVKKLLIIDSNYSDREMTLTDWFNYCKLTEEALEEVPSRIELIISQIDGYGMYKTNKTYWTDQEKDLCEKALNGELLDIDSLDDKDFAEWYCFNTILDITRQGINQ
jgi:hypothetical protein